LKLTNSLADIGRICDKLCVAASALKKVNEGRQLSSVDRLRMGVVDVTCKRRGPASDHALVGIILIQKDPGPGSSPEAFVTGEGASRAVATTPHGFVLGANKVECVPVVSSRAKKVVRD
jgi:hypothetical protein